MALQAYRRKRNFRRTSEPKGGGSGGGAKSTRRFVIQKHRARRPHEDLRLELGGAYASWAVPRGVPLKQGEKRLAVKVEDHPLSYGTFEGEIPKGEYGAGTVQVWDTGTFQPATRHPLKDLEGGKLHFTLHGSKLAGEWYLVRMHGKEEEWLLIRAGEDHRRLSREEKETSALSGRTLDTIRRDASPEAPAAFRPLPPDEAPFVEPMKARLVERPPEGLWRYEIKFDGYRTIACKEGNAVALLSRTRQDFTARFPEIARAVAGLNDARVVLDGEVVALDPEGRSSFQLLQNDQTEKERPPICYYVFDLLSVGGRPLLREPLEKRREKLKALLPDDNRWLRFSSSFESDVSTLLKEASRLKLEGVIGKRSGSLYEPGRRSGAWIKLKRVREQELVIGGYTPPKGGRTGFGALLVGTWEGRKLIYAGKVGSGFSHADLERFPKQFAPFATPDCPFSNLPEKRSGRYGQPITATAMKAIRWLKPKLVAQVRFTEWTRDGHLRHPVFVGLREDRPARTVVRETAV